jgi:hypothetical protein
MKNGNAKTNKPASAGIVALNLIFTIALLEGFTVVLLELAGGKLLSAYFGTSFTVWNLVLCVTFLTLAAGYFYGGIRSQKKNNGQQVYSLLTWAGIAIILMPLIANKIFELLSGFGFYGGLIICSFLLIGPPLFVTGMINAVLIQLNTHQEKSAGKISGRIYTLATLGGIAGVLLTGLVFLPLAGITFPLVITAGILILSGFIFFRPPKKLFPGLAGLVLLCLGLLFAFTSSKHKSSASFKVQYESEGVLGQLKVLDFAPPGKNFTVRKLLINGIPQTYILNSQMAYSFWQYPHLLAAFSTLKDPGSSCLLVGFGGGSVARELQKQKFKIDVVEIDKRVPAVASDYFYIDTSAFRITIDDIRHFSKTSKKKYDLIVMDVLSGEVQPAYVFTLEAMNDLKQIMNPGGLVVINYQGILNDPDDKAFPALYSTFKRSGFKTGYWATNPDQFDDIVFVMSNSDFDFKKIDAGHLDECCRSLPLMPKFVMNPLSPEKAEWEKAEPLIDDKPILDLLNSKAMIQWRKTMLKDITNEELKEGIRIFK